MRQNCQALLLTLQLKRNGADCLMQRCFPNYDTKEKKGAENDCFCNMENNLTHKSLLFKSDIHFASHFARKM